MRWAGLVWWALILGALWYLTRPASAGGRALVSVSASLSDVLGQGVSVSGAA